MIKGKPTIGTATYVGEVRMDGRGFLKCPACGLQLDVSLPPGPVRLVCNKPGGCNDTLEYTFSSHEDLQRCCNEATAGLMDKHGIVPEGPINITHEYGGPPPFSFETNEEEDEDADEEEKEG